MVRFRGASAVLADEGGVGLTWRTGHEVANLGFHVYRDGVRLTESPIAGSALLAGPQTVLTAGQAYGWVDPDGTASSAYTVEDLDLNGTRTMYGPFFAGAPPLPGRTLRRGEGRRPAQKDAVGPGRSRVIREVGRTGSGERRWFSTGAESDVAADLTTDVFTPATVTAATAGVTAEADPGTGQAALSQQYALARGRR